MQIENGRGFKCVCALIRKFVYFNKHFLSLFLESGRMIKTWTFFTLGGIFTAVYSNAVRKYPLMRSKLFEYNC